jgi:hypothetical protein
MAHDVTLEPTTPRRVIVHTHIMKCAGTTVAAILERELGDACYHVHRPDRRGVIYGEELAAFLRATPGARAVTSHHFRRPVPHEVGDIVDCAPLRRPTDRLESLYTFLARDASQRLHAVARDAGGLGPFLAALADRHPPNINDVQTAALAMRTWSRAPGQRDAARAIRRIADSSMVVVVDRFDESMVVAEYRLAGTWPGLQLHYQAHNTARALRYSVDEREDRFREQCGEEVYALVRRCNEHDEALWRAAGAELDRRIALIPSFAARLDAFRARCEAVSTRSGP